MVKSTRYLQNLLQCHVQVIRIGETIAVDLQVLHNLWMLALEPRRQPNEHEWQSLLEPAHHQLSHGSEADAVVGKKYHSRIVQYSAVLQIFQIKFYLQVKRGRIGDLVMTEGVGPK